MQVVLLHRRPNFDFGHAVDARERLGYAGVDLGRGIRGIDRVHDLVLVEDEVRIDMFLDVDSLDSSHGWNADKPTFQLDSNMPVPPPTNPPPSLG
jgi:hypothetical protein